ncbi:lytic transglycosylase domain-containing protein [Rhodobacteraceae bacterium D3-12]|nr:lytic transglycosylase domain-containing protein [Rhodobacteraceae bacterium D3-12]
MRRNGKKVAVAALLALSIASQGWADAPKPFENFTFKKVGPPKKGTKKKRITIHVTPEDMARQNPKLGRKGKPEEKTATGAAPAKPGAKDRPGHYAWFWDKISPDMDKSGPGRLELALNRIANPPGGKGGVKSPRLQGLQELARVRGAEILLATVGTEVSPALVLAVMSVESAGKIDAVSSAGAQGLMQLMPATAARFGVTDITKSDQNIKGGVAFLDFLMKEFNRDPILVLAGYNAGEGAVKTHKGVPPYAETRDYVPKVLAAFNTARGLCLTRPQLVTDGCVFNIDVSGGQ